MNDPTADSPDSIEQRLQAAKRGGRALSSANAERRTAALLAMAQALVEPHIRTKLLEANAADMAQAREAQARGELAEALVNRLRLTSAKLDVLVDGLRQLAAQDDHVGQVLLERELDDDLTLQRVACPLGLLAIVFEARPDAVPQIVGLAVRSGNAIALKGGREATRSNQAMVEVLQAALASTGLDPASVALLSGRAEVMELLRQDQLVDLVIARGSTQFVHFVQERSKIPVVGHAEGLCHVFLHDSADPTMAAEIVLDAKTSYPAACNALETLLWAPGAQEAMLACVKTLHAAGVRLRGCQETCNVSHMDLATEDDWDAEYGDLMLSIRRVEDVAAALEHIEAHGSRHTECIVAQDERTAAVFCDAVDAACVFHNASTRFADGYRFGLGAEVGISTQKLHARGPVGVEGLLTYRWILRGAGHVASSYGPGKRAFAHEKSSPSRKA